MAEERLQKIMAAAGIASRRACEKYIVAGRVKVNGVAVTELGTKVDSDLVQITVDGKPLTLGPRHVYYKLYKPRGVLSDDGIDSAGRQTVFDLLPTENTRRVFPVGRLDVPSEGLILLTDDGDLAHKLTHPRYRHTKTYYVLVATRPPESALERLRRGVTLPEGAKSQPAEAHLLERMPAGLQLGPGRRDGVWLEMILREGKKRQIRHMTAAVGCPTLRLVRWAIGPLTLDGLTVGKATTLTRRELTQLQDSLKPNRGKTQFKASGREQQKRRRR